MLSYSLKLRIASIFEIFLLSFIGIIIPFLLLPKQPIDAHRNDTVSPDGKNDLSLIFAGLKFQCMKAVSAGIMLGLGLVSTGRFCYCNFLNSYT
jgi:hypothetical protein